MSELQMYERLKALFPPNEYAMMPQVRNGTGYTKATRTADAVAISLWPSRGIDMIGFEFKSSRSDVMKELSSPEKSDEIGKHCAFWWLVVSDQKLISKDELPSAWGLIAIKDGVAKRVVKAPRRKAVDPDLPLLASIMRQAQGSVTGENDVQRRIAEAVSRARAEMENAHRDAEERRKKSEAVNGASVLAARDRFLKETGIDILMDGRYGRPLGDAVKFVLNGGLDNLSLVVGWCDRVSSEAKQLLGEQECRS